MHSLNFAATTQYTVSCNAVCSVISYIVRSLIYICKSAQVVLKIHTKCNTLSVSIIFTVYAILLYEDEHSYSESVPFLCNEEIYICNFTSIERSKLFQHQYFHHYVFISLCLPQNVYLNV